MVALLFMANELTKLTSEVITYSQSLLERDLKIFDVEQCAYSLMFTAPCIYVCDEQCIW